ncbi:cell division protein ZapB [Mesorhizobium loti]|nr:cell division protein ZapB [Mesorhizobium loti]
MDEPRSPSALSAARAYRAALARLVRGEGRHPDHQRRIVRISPASVAREAGKSRNPLYTTHRDILDEIEAAVQAPGPSKDLAAKVQEMVAEITLLRSEVRRHREEKRKLASENLALLLRARTAEDKLASLQRRAPLAPAAVLPVRPLPR